MKGIVALTIFGALLAVPAAMAANGGNGSNPAKQCKAEQAANPAAFSARYGTNGNDANAFGKCVSSRSQGQTVSSAFSEQSVGTLSSGTPGCQFTSAGCTLQASGTITGTPIAAGTYTGTLTIDWVDATSNGAGGYCAPAQGQFTLVDSADSSNTITKTETGTVCEVGPTGTNVEHTFNGTFTITGGTGIYAGASGGGTATSDQPANSSTSTGTENGTITY